VEVMDKTMDFKKRLNRFILLITLSLLFFGTTQNFSDDSICNAQNDHAVISISDFSYELKNREKTGKTVISRFIIYVELHNSGNKKSEDITVKIEDKDGFILKRNGSLLPGEYKTFAFDEWGTLGTGDQIINVSFAPTNLSIPMTSYNSGSQSFTIHVGEEENNNSTPGFNTPTILISILIILTYIYYRKRTRPDIY